MSLSEYEAKIDGYKKEFLQKHPEWVSFVVPRDPALQNLTLEQQKAQLMYYPGLTALAAWEKAHALAKENPAEARALSEAAKILSGGIEIHPESKLSWKTFIDHGCADVIGGNVSLGEGATLYSNVVLGNYNGDRDSDNNRHPQIGKDAVISTDVRIYGPCHIGNKVRIHPGARIITTDIGNNVVIGANVILDHAAKIPDNSYVTAKGQEVVISALADKEREVEGAPHWLVEQVTLFGRTVVQIAEEVFAHPSR